MSFSLHEISCPLFWLDIFSFCNHHIMVKRSHEARLEEIFSGSKRYLRSGRWNYSSMSSHLDETHRFFCCCNASTRCLLCVETVQTLLSCQPAPWGKVMKRLWVPQPSFCFPSRTWTRLHRWHTETNYTVLSDSDFIWRPIHVKPAFQKQGPEKTRSRNSPKFSRKSI